MSNIKINAGHLDLLMTPEVQALLKNPLPGIFGYRLARVVEKLEAEAKIYFEARKAFVLEFSDEEKSKGLPEGQVHIPMDRQEEFLKKNEVYASQELDLGIPPVEIDPDDEDLPSISVVQWKFLFPITKEKV